MFSDGVSDSLYDPAMSKCVRPYLDEDYLEDPMACSLCIANKAYELGKSRMYASPFAVGAQAAGKQYPNVGKPDDIVAICAQIHLGGQQRG